MELGQIAIDMMNARSEQRYNARQAAKSVIYLMGATDVTQGEVVDQAKAGSVVVAVRPTELPDGSKVSASQVTVSYTKNPIVGGSFFGAFTYTGTAVFRNLYNN